MVLPVPAPQEAYKVVPGILHISFIPKFAGADTCVQDNPPSDVTYNPDTGDADVPLYAIHKPFKLSLNAKRETPTVAPVTVPTVQVNPASLE